MMDRRAFLGLVGIGLSNRFAFPKLNPLLQDGPPLLAAAPQGKESKAFGSGYFGEWITDKFGLPAYRYTCNQITDPKAVTPVRKEWRAPTDHTHQVGNDRLVAAVSNYGYVQVRQDEGSPKFLNDYSPEDGRYGAGIGFLIDGPNVLSTYYPGNGNSFERVLGMGYLRKMVKGERYEIDQLIFAPFGDDPVLLSQVNLTNHGRDPANARWVEYWGCHNYQFSYRSLMEASVLGDMARGAELRREFGARFAHQFRELKNRSGLIETQKFLGRTPEEEEAWQKVQAFLKGKPTTLFGAPVPELARESSMEDLNPPSTFLVSLDAPVDGFATSAATFFGSGGVDHPSNAASRLNNDPGSTGEESAFLLERRFALKPAKARPCALCTGIFPRDRHSKV